jgi:hypothetical protein
MPQKNQEILPAKEVKNKCYDDANEQTRRQRKIKRKALPLNINVARQMSQPGQFATQREN